MLVTARRHGFAAYVLDLGGGSARVGQAVTTLLAVASLAFPGSIRGRKRTDNAVSISGTLHWNLVARGCRVEVMSCSECAGAGENP